MNIKVKSNPFVIASTAVTFKGPQRRYENRDGSGLENGSENVGVGLCLTNHRSTRICTKTPLYTSRTSRIHTRSLSSLFWFTREHSDLPILLTATIAEEYSQKSKRSYPELAWIQTEAVERRWRTKLEKKP
ncbi:unnamed protein product [Rhodiola kirilowii]